MCWRSRSRTFGEFDTFFLRGFGGVEENVAGAVSLHCLCGLIEDCTSTLPTVFSRGLRAHGCCRLFASAKVDQFEFANSMQVPCYDYVCYSQDEGRGCGKAGFLDCWKAAGCREERRVKLE